MPSKRSTPLVFGASSVRSQSSPFSSSESLTSLFTTLQRAGITTIDTAQMYADSETVLGAAGVASYGFTLDTKSPGGWIPGSLEPTKLAADARRSKEILGVDKIDVFYIHGPDATGTYPLEETLSILNSLYTEGIFSRLGLSNFSAAQVKQAHDICSERGWVAPSVFQGNYSAFARHAEAELLPTLRRLGMAFYAYSPLAGGFLARRDADSLFGESGGRFAKNGKRSFAMYQGLYSDKTSLVAALGKWASLADKAGCESPAELGYRWVAWNGGLDPDAGDKVIIGASRIEQTTQVSEWIAKGPLSDGIVKEIDELWEEVKDEAPLDNWHK